MYHGFGFSEFEKEWYKIPILDSNQLSTNLSDGDTVIFGTQTKWSLAVIKKLVMYGRHHGVILGLTVLSEHSPPRNLRGQYYWTHSVYAPTKKPDCDVWNNTHGDPGCKMGRCPWCSRHPSSLITIDGGDLNGADVRAGNDDGLVHASENGYLEMVEFLVEEGADVHESNDKALICASENGHLEVVKFLIFNGADVHAVNDEALRRSLMHGHSDVVRFLTLHGADMHAV
jgi:hypothetical protein